MNSKKKEFKIKEDQLNGLINLLAEMPFKSVYQAMNLLHNLEEIKDEGEKDASKA